MVCWMDGLDHGIKILLLSQETGSLAETAGILMALVDNQQKEHVQNAPLLLIILGTLTYKYVFVANVGCDY